MHPGELGGIGINYPSDDEESVDKQVEAVQQQHGMVPHASSPNSSLSHTPCSSAPGSRVRRLSHTSTSLLHMSVCCCVTPHAYISTVHVSHGSANR